MSVCISKHLQECLEDREAKPLLLASLRQDERRLEFIRQLFTEEKLPIPQGYTENDVDLSAPPLFFDLFPLSYTYGMARIGLESYSRSTTSAARKDIRKFFSENVKATLSIFNEAVDLMLSKGIYDRPAFIPYPEHIQYTEKKKAMLSGLLAPPRPLNVLELSEIFFNIERNYFGIILLTAFIQVVKDKAIQQFLIRGKKIAQQQVEFLNDKLTKEDLLGTIMVNTEVSASTVSPFSDRLILGLVTMTNSLAISYMGHAISTASRLDLITEYSRWLAEIMKYGNEGIGLMVERRWMEEPPHAPDRQSLANV